MTWFRFISINSTPVVRELSGEPIIIISAEEYLGEGSTFSEKIILLNERNRNQNNEWLNFKYSKSTNAWHRPLRNLRLSDIYSEFSDDIEFIDLPLGKIHEKKSTVSGGTAVTKSYPKSFRDTDANSTRISESSSTRKSSHGEQVDFLLEGDRNGIREVRGIGTGIEATDKSTNSIRNSESNLGFTDTSGLEKHSDTTVKTYENYAPIKRGENLDHRTNSERFTDNLNAIRTIINKQNTYLSSTEVEIVSKFSGWGGLAKDVLDDGKKLLTEILTPEQRKGVYDSVLFGYYTPNSLIKDIWDLAVKKGYRGGLVLESSASIGKFISERDTSFDHQQHFTAVEIDRISADICKALHPGANVINAGFEKCYVTKIKNVGFDLCIGNFPFGETAIIDEYGVSRSIHNYFLLKNIEALRPGGILIAITSTHTLDAENPSFRKQIAENSQLLSALRLPNGLFEGTDVQSDILVFRKTGNGDDQKYTSLPFTNTVKKSYPAIRDFYLLSENGKEEPVKQGDLVEVSLNECFAQENPKARIAGHISVGLVGRGTKPGLILEGDYETVRQEIHSIKQNDEIPWFDQKNSLILNGVPNLNKGSGVIAYKKPTVGCFIEHNNEVYVVTSYSQESQFEYVLDVAKPKLPSDRGLYNKFNQKIDPKDLIRAYIEIRDCVSELLESEQLGNADSMNIREKLNSLYDEFVGTYGFFNSKMVRKFIRNDALVGIVLGLEHYDSENEDNTYKADIFHQSTIKKIVIPDSAQTLNEAVSISLMQFGAINQDFIEKLLNKTLIEAMLSEPGVIFLNPVSDEYEHRSKYLVGNVVEKLRIAEERIDSNELLSVNIKHLREVIPPRLRAEEISISFGTRWLPQEFIHEFLAEIFTKEGLVVKTYIRESKDSATQLELDYIKGGRTKYDDIVESKYGTDRAGMDRIIESLMASCPIQIRDSVTIDGSTKSILNVEKTATANNKREFVAEEFSRWVLSKDSLRSKIEDIYNNQVNVYNYTPDFTGINYQFQGMSSSWEPREHQREFVLRAIVSGNMLNADCVGSGKTGMQVMLAHELSRLGISRFPAIVVPNHMLYQTAGEAQQIYPSAKICIVTKEDLVKENRAAFVAKMTMNKWDFCVVTYGMNQQILPPSDYLVAKIDEQIEDLKFALNSLPKEERLSRRNIIHKLQKQEKILNDLLNDIEENAFPIQLNQVGIDAFLYDEFHKLKNLELNMVRSIPGVASQASQISFTEYLKMQYIMETYYCGQEKGIFAFTATPISNSIAELYSIKRMLKPSLLQQEGIRNFNDWAAAYGEVITALEVLPEGNGFQMKSRLSSFKNLPELLASFRSFTQLHTREQLSLPAPSYTEENIVVNPGKWQQYIFNFLFQRASELRGSTSKNDNFLAIVNDAVMAAISAKALDPAFPTEETKVHSCAKNVFRIYQESVTGLDTQLIFLDRSTPTTESSYNAYDEIKELLISFGIPANEIAFIHDASTDLQRFELQRKVREGKIRVLLGSTEKLGTGTNVQKHLIAIHDLDIPWTPKELEQRLGRVVRQGNTHDHVFIYRYTTKGSFDVYRLETIRRKAVLISNAMLDPRTAMRTYSEDTAIDYDAMIAATTDSPIIKQKAIVDSKYMKLKSKERDFYNEKYDKKAQLDYAVKKLDDIKEKFNQRHSALHRIFTAIENAPKLIFEGQFDVDKSISESLKKSFERKSNILKACIRTPAISDVCDGETTWIDYASASLAVQRICAGNFIKDDVRISIYGEDCLTYKDEFGALNIELYETKGEKPYYTYSTRAGAEYLLSYLLTVPTNDLAISVNNLKNEHGQLEESIRYLSTLDLSQRFPQERELQDLALEKAEIEAKVTELMATMASEKVEIPPFETMLEMYASTEDKANFDPNNSSSWAPCTAVINKELIEEALFTPV